MGAVVGVLAALALGYFGSAMLVGLLYRAEKVHFLALIGRLWMAIADMCAGE